MLRKTNQENANQENAVLMLRILLLADEVRDTVIDATKERTAAQVTHTTASRLF